MARQEALLERVDAPRAHLSTLFPNAAQPTLGVFDERQTLGLAALPDVEVQVSRRSGCRLAVSATPLRARAAGRAGGVEGAGSPPAFRVSPVGRRRTARRWRGVLPMRGSCARASFDVIDADSSGRMAGGDALSRRWRALLDQGARRDIQYWGPPRHRRQIVRRGGGGLLAVSEALKDVMAGLGMPDTVRVHHTGVELERFRPIDRAAPRRGLASAGRCWSAPAPSSRARAGDHHRRSSGYPASP
jgi:hypothetical protein